MSRPSTALTHYHHKTDLYKYKPRRSKLPPRIHLLIDAYKTQEEIFFKWFNTRVETVTGLRFFQPNHVNQEFLMVITGVIAENDFPPPPQYIHALNLAIQYRNEANYWFWNEGRAFSTGSRRDGHLRWMEMLMGIRNVLMDGEDFEEYCHWYYND